MKKRISMLLAVAMMLTLASCGNKANTPSSGSQNNAGSQGNTSAGQSNAGGDAAEDWHIGIITGTVSQSEDDLRGAEAIRDKYGADKVKLATYPDNFTEETETTIQSIVNMSDDPLMKAVIVNQSPAPPRLSARSRSAAPTSCASPARPTRTCPLWALPPIWSATTTSFPAAI